MNAPIWKIQANLEYYLIEIWIYSLNLHVNVAYCDVINMSGIGDVCTY